jgi:hypothetical protein
MPTPRAQEATSAFTVESRDNDPTEFAGGDLVRARWSKALTGEINGHSEVHLLLLQQTDGPAAYVGLERYDVEIHGRHGTFLLMHSATMNGSDHQATWTIVSGSGTGDLVGLSGDAEITPEHQFILRYTLPD